MMTYREKYEKLRDALLDIQRLINDGARKPSSDLTEEIYNVSIKAIYDTTGQCT